MNESMSIQKAFLLFEGSFCLLVSLFLALHIITADRKNLSNKIIMICNFLAGILLYSDFFAYHFSGDLRTEGLVGTRTSNFVVFLATALILLAYSMYVSVQLFGSAGVKYRVPGRRRIRIVYSISVISLVILILSQFTGLLYWFDSSNKYHRGILFLPDVVLFGIAIFLILTVLIQYRNKIDRLKFFALLSYVVFPVIGTILQVNFYGFSFINIMIGFSLLIMFIENSVSQSKEILRVSKLEVRTGLLNEHGCIEELYKLRKKARLSDYTAVYFDICKFSEINRKYGMKAGDLVLKSYAQKIEEKLEEGEILARQGSDHFISVVKKENLDKVLDILKGTQIEFVYGPKDEKTGSENVKAIAGVYEIDSEKIKGEDILANSYTALLYAKTISKKPVDYMTAELRKKIDNERLYGTLLIEGLEKEEFFPYYQPKVNIHTNELCGAEALARWYHEGKIVTPGQFIPIMEKNDSVCALDFYILKHVCSDIEEWIAEGLEIPTISVNFSRRNLVNKSLAEDIDKAVSAFDIPKNLIEIEITETNDEFPLSVLKDFVSELHELGFKVAVDDFGCGAASLSLLREADFDTLKIDKSFIDNAFEKDITILTHIVNLAKAIDMKIVAEGVENEWQEETLHNLGVGIVQGFFFDKAVPKEEIVKRLRKKGYTQK